ncbi:MAG TPA: 1,4-alpha-glucan branching protein GlgB [Chloroflexota bacterium]|nr:1,4-alpha-glucan branching protein GlgB [Chloroflexota bacterium]
MALSEYDLYLFGTGEHQEAYRRLGAHPGRHDGAEGVQFSVWAPNADAVSVIADFNGWTPGATTLVPIQSSGIWRGFVAGARPGTAYKFAVRPRGVTRWLEKADPYAFAAELRPATASIVADLDGFSWSDAGWLARRAQTNWQAAPIAVYEVHLGSWRRDPSDPRRFLTYRELGDMLPSYAADMGFTHVELLPVAEHPLDMSWGYQTTGYFAPSARFGSPRDFMYFVDCCHAAGLGVILDWVPAHFPKDAHALGQFDGTHLYEHADPRMGEHPDWGTYIFNYGRSEVRSFLVSNALFWPDVYHVDGLRVDAVASMLYLDYSRQDGEWLPNRYGGRENLEAIDFLRQTNGALHARFPGVLTIAEESTAWPNVTGSLEDGGLGFDLKWNMGWMHDTLSYFSRDPVHRRFHQNELTFSIMYAFSERFLLPLSHDEVVHGKRSLLDKMPGDGWQKFANLRLLLAYMYGHPGKKLLFMGDEIAQGAEWDHSRSLDWHLLEEPGEGGAWHRGIQTLTAELNALLQDRAALHEIDSDWRGFEWLDFSDAENSVIAFRRKSTGQESLVFVCNFTPVVRDNYRVGLPDPGSYKVLLNTDEERFGGSGAGQRESFSAGDTPWHGRPYSAEIILPPLALIVLERG